MRRSALGPLAVNLGVQHALAELSARVKRPLHRPSKVTFEIVEICNLKCTHCDIWTRRRSPGAMRQEEWSAHLADLAGWLGPFALGFRSGEPLMAPEFWTLVAQASRLGVLTTCVTNGTLIDPISADRLAASGLDSLHFSLDGLRPRTHDLSRGVAGTHDKVLAAIALMRRAGGPRLKLNTLVAGHNLGELEDLVRWTAEMGLAGISFQALRPFGADWESLWPEPGEAAKVLQRLLRMKSDGYPVLNPAGQLLAMARYFEAPDAGFPEETCGTYAHWNVRADGSVRTCSYKEPIGNVRRETPQAIWAGAASRERFSEVLDCRRECLLLNCHFKPGLAARAAELGRHLLLR